MDWELRNTICDLEVLKDKFDDLLAAHNYFGDEMFEYRELPNQEQVRYYALGYKKSRIHHEQTNDLLTIYLKQYDELISKFKALDIKRDRTHDEIGNGQHNVEQ